MDRIEDYNLKTLQNMICHLLKKWMKIMSFHIDKPIFHHFLIIYSWDVNRKVKGKSLIIMKNVCCYTLKFLTCRNILDMNWAIACQKLVKLVYKKSITGVVNVRWVSPPCNSPYTGGRTRLCTTHQSIIFFNHNLPYHGMVPDR